MPKAYEPRDGDIITITKVIADHVKVGTLWNGGWELLGGSENYATVDDISFFDKHRIKVHTRGPDPFPKTPGSVIRSHSDTAMLLDDGTWVNQLGDAFDRPVPGAWQTIFDKGAECD